MIPEIGVSVGDKFKEFESEYNARSHPMSPRAGHHQFMNQHVAPAAIAGGDSHSNSG